MPKAFVSAHFSFRKLVVVRYRVHPRFSPCGNENSVRQELIGPVVLGINGELRREIPQEEKAPWQLVANRRAHNCNGEQPDRGYRSP